MEYFVMYLLFSTERIAEFMSFFGNLMGAGALYFVVFGFTLLFSHPVKGGYDYEGNKNFHDSVKNIFNKTKVWVVLVMLFSFFMTAGSKLIPNQRDMAYIIGGGVVYNIVTSDKAKEVSDKSLQVIIKKLDEMVEDKK